MIYECRSYYRCTNPRCNAKRQVERSLEDPDVLVVTYEGLHLHYSYPQFFLSRLPQLPPQKTISPLAGSPLKKLKTQIMEDPLASNTISPVKNWIQEDAQEEEEEEEEEMIRPAIVPRREETRSNAHQQGLLEDIVPKLVRNPAFYDELTSVTCSPSSPPSSSSSSSCLSWSSLPSFFDAGTLFANI